MMVFCIFGGLAQSSESRSQDLPLVLFQDQCVGTSAPMVQKLLQLELGRPVVSENTGAVSERLEVSCEADEVVVLTWKREGFVPYRASMPKASLTAKGSERVLALELVDFLELARRDAQKTAPPKISPPTPPKLPPPEEPTSVTQWDLAVVGTTNHFDAGTSRLGGGAWVRQRWRWWHWRAGVKVGQGQEETERGEVTSLVGLGDLSWGVWKRWGGLELSVDAGLVGGIANVQGESEDPQTEGLSQRFPLFGLRASPKGVVWLGDSIGVSLGGEVGWWVVRALATDGEATVAKIAQVWVGAEAGVIWTF